MMTHFSGKVTIKAVVERNGLILVTLDKRWELPGGRLDVGESIADAVARELKEELGIDAVAGKLLYSQQYRQERDGTDALMLVVQALWDEGQTITPDLGEVKNFTWIAEHHMHEMDFYPNIANALRHYFTHRG